MVANNPGEVGWLDVTFEHFPTSDDACLLGAKNTENFHLTFVFFDDFGIEEVFHFVLSVVEELVDHFVSTNWDIVASSHFGNINRDADIKTIDNSIVAGGHVDVVFVDVADASADDVEGDFTVSIDKFE